MSCVRRHEASVEDVLDATSSTSIASSCGTTSPSRIRTVDSVTTPGWYVAWRDHGVHVSAPSVADGRRDRVAARRESGRAATTGVLARVRTAAVSARDRTRRCTTTSTRTRGSPTTSSRSTRRDSPCCAARPAADEWEESGIPDALDEGGEALAVWGATGDSARPWVPALLGGAVLTETAGANRDIGLLVAADARRTRHRPATRDRLPRRTPSPGTAGRAGRCPTTNEPSLRTAARIGFEPYATQLAIRA